MAFIRFIRLLFKIYGGAGILGNGLTAIAVIAFYGRDSLMEKIRDVSVRTATDIGPLIPEFCKAWAWLPLLILTACAFGKEIVGLRKKINDANDLEAKLGQLLKLRESGLALKNEFKLDKKLGTLDEWMDRYNAWAESTMPAYRAVSPNEELLEKSVDYRELIRTRYPKPKKIYKFELAYEIITERIVRLERCYYRYQARQIPNNAD